jgi:hypothetical protein
VGHSAGGIYVSRLLEEIERRGLPAALTARVILIAPACTFTMLTRSLQKAGARVSGLRVFGMGDANERKDWIATVLYPASLLYFVSGVIEDERDAPLVGMERYYREPYKGGTFPDIDWIKSFACFTQDRSCVWSDRTDEPGFRCDMRSHGGWVEAPMTLDSVLHILKSEDGNG